MIVSKSLERCKRLVIGRIRKKLWITGYTDWRMKPILRVAGNFPEFMDLWNKIKKGQAITSHILIKKSLCMEPGSVNLIL